MLMNKCTHSEASLIYILCVLYIVEHMCHVSIEFIWNFGENGFCVRVKSMTSEKDRERVGDEKSYDPSKCVLQICDKI